MVIFDKGHVLRKSDLAFKNTQPLAPSKLTTVPNTLVKIMSYQGKEIETRQSTDGLE